MTVSLARLEHLLAEATEPPWIKQNGRQGTDFVCTEDARPESWTCIAECAFDRPEGNAALICEAVNSLPVLIAAVKALNDRHEFECGCDEPGDPNACCGDPPSEYEPLAAFSFEEQA